MASQPSAILKKREVTIEGQSFTIREMTVSDFMRLMKQIGDALIAIDPSSGAVGLKLSEIVTASEGASFSLIKASSGVPREDLEVMSPSVFLGLLAECIDLNFAENTSKNFQRVVDLVKTRFTPRN